jgi:acyl-CoA synthetase (AMP-forming)/AMP-acid ligase II
VNIARFLEQNAALYGEQPAIMVHDRVHATHRELARAVRNLAGALRMRYCLTPGERVGLFMANCPQFLEILLACWHAGLVAVPINNKLHAREAEFILDHSQTALCFAGHKQAAELAALNPAWRDHVVDVGDGEYDSALYYPDDLDCAEVCGEDPAWLFYTSGTTGRPKGATLSHRNLLCMIWAYFADIDRLGPADAVLHAAPLSHGSGLYGLPHLAKGGTHIIPQSEHFDPTEVAQLLRRHHSLSMFAAPTMVRRLTLSTDMAESRLSSLKTIVYGGAPMYRQHLDEALAMFGPCLAQIYGQGEAPMTITALPKDWHVPADGVDAFDPLSTVGLARTGVEVRTVDEEGEPTRPGVPGEVVVRGDVVMSGYWRDAAATSRTLQSGWLYTGDVGVLDGRGFLTLVDRSKDVIISGGSNIYPREVEEVLLRHPAVRDVAVIGTPSDEWGEDVAAFVVARPDMAPFSDELNKICLDNLAKYKRPKHYFFVSELPYNEYGKVSKVILRNIISAGRGDKDRHANSRA